MAADTAGNDIGQVPVPVTGFAAWNPKATAAPKAADLKADALPSGYTYLGLFTQDGGYAEEVESGEDIEFFQQGYSLQAGDESVSGTITFAENSEIIRQLMGYDSGTDGTRKTTVYNGQFGLIIATTYKNGKTMLRGGMATVSEASPSQETRGEVSSYEVTFKWTWATDIGFYRFKIV